ncbi:MAG: response regulator [Candidatus Omnitrophota bacterium]|nr:response regulator [Candidatus Omnitrophota bacterium]
MAKKKILIIEDEPDAALFLKMHLEKSGFNAICASDGKEGFEKVRTETPDLILLDLMLPQVDGLWVCNILKSDKRFTRIPIIILTAKATDSDMAVAKKCGANGYMVKPFEFSDLLIEIKKFLKD